MAIPEYAYTQTVGKKTMANAVLPSAWIMFINVKADIIVYKQAAAGGPAVFIPAADYTVTITPAAPWEFTWTYSGPIVDKPGLTDFIIIFRRVAAIFNDFQPGAFLNADTLNEAFNIETLANNDQGYYQQFSKPGYNDETLAEHGVFAPPLSPGQDDYHNPKLPETEYDLPYLAENPANQYDQYVWAFEVSALGPPRTGQFVSTVLSAAGTPTAGELKNELQRECTGGPPGTNIVGTCTTTIDGLGWTTPPGMTVTEYFGNLYHSDAGNPFQNGATLVGYGGWSGYTSVGGALDALKSTAAAEGGYLVGYNGWGIADATVSGALQRLNEPATSAADSGATHVKFWDTFPIIPVSKSVQQGLTELWQAIYNTSVPYQTVTVTFPTTGAPQIFILNVPGNQFSNLLKVHIRTTATGPNPNAGTWQDDITLAGSSVLTWEIAKWAAGGSPFYMSITRSAAAVPTWSLGQAEPANMFPIICEMSFYLKPGVTP